MTEPTLPRTVTRFWAQVLPFEIAARELRVAPSIVRQASDAQGRIAFGDAVAAAVAFYTAKIDPAALDAALTPIRRGPKPGQYGTPPERLRLRRDAACAAQHLATEIEVQICRLADVARAQAPAQPVDARLVTRLARELDRLAAALAKRNTRAVRGLGPKEVKT